MFAVLLRSPWWVSAAVAGVLFASARLLLPEGYAVYAFFIALPFLVISVVTAWRQWRAPGEQQVREGMESLRALSWQDFSSAVESSFAREGFAVERLTLPGADFELRKAGRVTLVSAKRWKAARTGVEPLRDLEAACRAREADEGLYIVTGEVSDNAAQHCNGRRLRLLQGAALLRFLPGKAAP